MHRSQRTSVSEVRFERAERRDQDAGGSFLLDSAAIPPLALRPFPQRPLPPQHVPQAGAGRRGGTADRLQDLPDLTPRRLDARAGRFFLEPRPELGDAQVRRIGGPQGIELRHREAGAKILAGLPHARGDRAAPLHNRQRVDGFPRAGRPAGAVRNRAGNRHDRALAQAFRSRP